MSIAYMSPLTPYFVTKPWAGKRLAVLKNLSNEASMSLGESWEISRLEEGLSLDVHGMGLNYFSQDELPYLVKFIDTDKPLSVQVHPHDKYAAKYEDCLGKTECWIILEAAQDAGIYLGFKEDVTEVDFFKDVENGKDLTQYLQFYPVKAGDFFYVPAGSIHALGGGITLAEIQQSSGVTYRVWDWNRVDESGESRELHIEQAKAVLNFSPDGNNPSIFQMKNIFEESEGMILEHPQFKISFYKDQCSLNKVGVEQRVCSVVNLNQKINLKSEEQVCQLEPYQCLLVKNGHELEVKGGQFLVIE